MQDGTLFNQEKGTLLGNSNIDTTGMSKLQKKKLKKKLKKQIDEEKADAQDNFAAQNENTAAAGDED